MQTDVTSTHTSNNATPRLAGTIATNKAAAEEKLRALSNSGTGAQASVTVPALQQRQPPSQLHRIAKQINQLNQPTTTAPSNMSLIPPSQAVPDQAMIDAADAAAADQQENPPPQSVSPLNAYAPPPPPLVVASVPSMAPLPQSFTGMMQTKQRQTEAITLYRSQQQMLTAARDDLAKFDTNGRKNAPTITLPSTLRANFSQVRFIAVEDDAAFYKQIMDQLKLEEDKSAQAAFDLIVQGKKKYIVHLESLVKSDNFVARAIVTYSAFVEELNNLFEKRGSSTKVPLKAAVLQFETKLRKEMDLFDAQQVEAQLVAQERTKEIAAAERHAEERIVNGSHNGNNITQIATKAAKTELVQTKKDLAAAHSKIIDLQEKFNLLAGSVPSQPPQTQPRDRSAAAKPTTGTNKRKMAELASKPKPRVDPDAMSDEQVATVTLPKSSNFHGGGRPTHHQSKKHKAASGKEGSGTALAVKPNKRQ